MDDFVTEMHGSSGLTEQIKASTVTIEAAEKAVLGLVEKHCGEHRPPLAGNSIATDRSFIRAQMPRLDATLHYRMIDVSTVKELTRGCVPKAYYNQPDKGMAHRALADIVESIRELDYYRRSAGDRQRHQHDGDGQRQGDVPVDNPAASAVVHAAGFATFLLSDDNAAVAQVRRFETFEPVHDVEARRACRWTRRC